MGHSSAGYTRSMTSAPASGEELRLLPRVTEAKGHRQHMAREEGREEEVPGSF